MRTFHNLGVANKERQKHWAGADQVDLAFIGLELAEEAGEVAGAVKKIIRHDRGIAGNKGKSREELMSKLRDEIGDTFINLSRLCNALGVDPARCTRDKFNRVSREQGIDVFLVDDDEVVL